MALLEIDDLTVKFYTPDGVVTAVDRLSYTIDRGEKFGVVGESGAGKSVTALSLLRLIESPGEIEQGSVRFHDPETVEQFAQSYSEHVVDIGQIEAEYDPREVGNTLTDHGVSGSDLTGDPQHEDSDVRQLLSSGQVGVRDLIDRGYGAELGLIDDDDFIVHDGEDRIDDEEFAVREGDDSYIELLRAPEGAVRQLRGNNIAMIFQDAQTALNPVYTIGEQIAEAIRHHLDYNNREAKARTIQLLDTVGIPDAENRYSDFPHEFSGGMQQRVVIAMALSCDPDVLIADEPTTALDVTTEAKILELLDDLTEEFDTAIQLITHDLGVVAELCDRVMVMYAGQAVERAPVTELYYDPKHPYTVGLMSSIPRIGDDRETLQTIPGTMPDLIDVPSGCRFHPRCPYAEESCKRTAPRMVAFDESVDRSARCLEYTDELEGGLTYTVSVRDDVPADTPGERISGEQHE